jgi:hypothetical protein
MSENKKKTKQELKKKEVEELPAQARPAGESVPFHTQ